MDRLKIGDIVTLIEFALDNEAGSTGIVIGEFKQSKKIFGAIILFENGQFDRFTDIEQQLYVSKTGHHKALAGYSKIKREDIEQDYENGVFDEVFDLYPKNHNK